VASRKGGNLLGVKPFAFCLSIVVSALFTATAMGSPNLGWVAWLSLLPLFFAIRQLRPIRASACGAIWGISLLGFSVAIGRWENPLDVWSMLLTAVIPAVYALAASALTRWIGFSPFVLGVGWMGVEFALAPLGLHFGLLASTQGDAAVMDYIGRALGYVLVGFLVAYVNAALVAVLARVCLDVRRSISWTVSTSRGALLSPQTFGRLSHLVLQPSRPRAPPLWG